MHYHLYDLYRQSLAPVNTTLDLVHDIVAHRKISTVQNTLWPVPQSCPMRPLFVCSSTTPKQGFEYEPVTIDDKTYPVIEEVMIEKTIL